MKYLIAMIMGLTLFVCAPAFATFDKVNAMQILTAATATGAGVRFKPQKALRSFILSGATSSGAGAASVVIEVSNDGTNYITQDTLGLTLGTTITFDSGVFEQPYMYVRARVASISGTGASVNVWMGTGGK